MKIKIENFGPIHSFEMDLDKDMHILYGENNVGKSYAISLLFLILQKLEELYKAGSTRAEFHEYSILSTVSIPAKGETNVTNYFRDAIRDLFSGAFLSNLINSLTNTRGEPSRWKNLYNIEKTSIWLYFDTYSIEIAPSNDKLLAVGEIKFEYEYFLVHRRSVSVENNRIEIEWVYIEEAEDSQLIISPVRPLPIDELKNHIDIVAYYLPATRSGVYSALGGLSSIFARLSQIRHLLPGERIDLPSLPEPTSDFFLRIASITGVSRDGQLREVYTRMEQELIKGEVVYNNFSKKIQYYQTGIDATFDLEQISSMVSELSIIIAFLKFVIRHPSSRKPVQIDEEPQFFWFFVENPVLFIEEPEAHLHPEVQVKLMAYLAELSKLGVKIVITTHSNYMFNKASNLILKGELEEERVANYHMIMTKEGSEVNEKITLHDWGMEDENFGNVAEELLNERLQAAEDFNANVTH